MTTSASARSTLDRIIATIGELPASPAIVSSVMGLTSNPDSKIMDVSRVLSADQSLTAKILKLSNSSFYGRPKGVQSLQEAILLLGFSTLRSIVVATSAHLMYTRGIMSGPGGDLWRHSLATAVAARQVAKRINHPMQEEVFIAALLHDIGKLVLLQKMPDQYKNVIATVQNLRVSFFEAEASILGFNHCEVAGILLEQWHFPDVLRQAIVAHHDAPQPFESGPPPIAMLVNLGNFMARNMDNGCKKQSEVPLEEQPSAVLLKLDKAKLSALMAEIIEHYQNETSIFEST